MARRWPWGSQIAVKRSKVNNAITRLLNFKTYSHLFQLLEEITIPKEQLITFVNPLISCCDSPKKTKAGEKSSKKARDVSFRNKS